MWILAKIIRPWVSTPATSRYARCACIVRTLKPRPCWTRLASAAGVRFKRRSKRFPLFSSLPGGLPRAVGKMVANVDYGKFLHSFHVDFGKQPGYLLWLNRTGLRQISPIEDQPSSAGRQWNR